MPKLFTQTIDGNHIYTCSRCEVEFTNHRELISKAFTGQSGPAMLFGSVINVSYGPAEERPMKTGKHVVRSVYCVNCGVEVGWIYDFAYMVSEKYKEGKTILEKARIRKIRWEPV